MFDFGIAVKHGEDIQMYFKGDQSSRSGYVKIKDSSAGLKLTEDGDQVHAKLFGKLGVTEVNLQGAKNKSDDGEQKSKNEAKVLMPIDLNKAGVAEPKQLKSKVPGRFVHVWKF